MNVRFTPEQIAEAQKLAREWKPTRQSPHHQKIRSLGERKENVSVYLGDKSV